MKNFDYAHKNTGGGERVTPTAKYNSPELDKQLQEIRCDAFEREIPVSDDETLNFLQTLLRIIEPENILELGTAVGVSGAAMLLTCPKARLTTVEKDENFYSEAENNFKKLKVFDRVFQILGDAGEVVNQLEETFDFIFMDCAKVQYIKYLPALKKLLKKGGTLVADDVLLFGYLTGEAEVPKKRKMLVEHIKEYLTAVTEDEELATTVINIGDGIALSVKK